MSIALYRKYRPQVFADLIGQNHIKITLQNEIEQGQIGHAYLFCGPRGLGKTTTARLFAKAINCTKRQAGETEPCNECASCLDIINNRSVDIMEIDAASNTGVENVRENIIENSRFTPNSSKYKVFIIDEVHMLSIQAFNALLKTMEEPPAHVIFILCTTETHKLPLTIISRCQRFDFRKVSAANMTKRLETVIAEEKKEIDPEVVKRIVFYSDGCVRDAESLLGKIFSLGDKITLEQAELILPRSDFGSVIHLINFLAEKNSAAAVELVNKLFSEGLDLQIFAENILEFLRKLLLLKISPQLGDFTIELGEDNQKLINALVKKLSFAELLTLIDLLMKKSLEMKRSPVIQLPLELAIVGFCENVSCRELDEAEKSGLDISDKIRQKPLQPAEPESKKKDLNNIETKADNEISKAADSEPQKIATEAATGKQQPDSQPEQEVNMGSDITVEIFRQQWAAIVNKILTDNYSVSSVLRMSRPVKAGNNNLEIAVKTRFFKDRLDVTANKLLIEETILSLMGITVSVKVIVDPAVEPLEGLILSEVAIESAPVESPARQPAEPAESKPVNIIPRINAVEDVIAMF